MADLVDQFIAAGDPLVHQLLGCAWGRRVQTADDTDPCPARANQIVVIHDGPREHALKLCTLHLERIAAETTPREEPARC